MIGPTPGNSSSSSTVADERLTVPPTAPSPLGASARPSRAGCCAARHEDLDPVDERSGEIHPCEVGITGRATRPADRVGDAGAVAQSIEPRPAHFADDVDDELGTRRRRSNGLELGDDGFRLARGSGLRETLADQREQGQRDADSDDRGRAGDGDGHDAIVAAHRSHVVHDSVERLQKGRPRAARTTT